MLIDELPDIFLDFVLTKTIQNYKKHLATTLKMNG